MNGANMAAIMITVAAITEMVRGRMGAVPLNAIVGKPTLNSVRHLFKRLATFAIHFVITKWGGKHGFLPIFLSKAKMRLVTEENNPD